MVAKDEKGGVEFESENFYLKNTASDKILTKNGFLIYVYNKFMYHISVVVIE